MIKAAIASCGRSSGTRRPRPIPASSGVVASNRYAPNGGCSATRTITVIPTIATSVTSGGAMPAPAPARRPATTAAAVTGRPVNRGLVRLTEVLRGCQVPNGPSQGGFCDERRCAQGP